MKTLPHKHVPSNTKSLNLILPTNVWLWAFSLARLVLWEESFQSFKNFAKVFVNQGFASWWLTVDWTAYITEVREQDKVKLLPVKNIFTIFSRLKMASSYY